VLWIGRRADTPIHCCGTAGPRTKEARGHPPRSIARRSPPSRGGAVGARMCAEEQTRGLGFEALLLQGKITFCWWAGAGRGEWVKIIQGGFSAAIKMTKALSTTVVFFKVNPVCRFVKFYLQQQSSSPWAGQSGAEMRRAPRAPFAVSSRSLALFTRGDGEPP